MDGKRSVVRCVKLEVVVGLLLVFAIQLSVETDPGDVAAINNLYVALESPSLPGWVAVGGDPCNELWQGVECENASIVTIRLNAANLGGELRNNLGSFSSLKTIFLSANEFTGSIPNSLSYLSQLSAMSLNGNHLTGNIPDSFQGLTGLVNLDLSSNNLSGPLPQTLGHLSSLNTLHLQNNQLSGTLDVLQDLPLVDLNVESNLFSGPIPQKLLSIPNFNKDGNLFNSSIAPLPAPTSSTVPLPSPSFPGPPISTRPPPSQEKPRKRADGPSESILKGSKKSLFTKRVIWISIAAVLSFIILVIAILLFLPMCLRKWHETQGTPKKQLETTPYTMEAARENPRDSGSLVQRGGDIEKAPLVVKPKEKQPRRPIPIPKPHHEQEINVKTVPKKDSGETNIHKVEIDLMLPPLPPQLPPTLSQEKVIVKPPTRPLPPTAVKCYSVASLQQYTCSFSQDNLLGTGTLGSVYRAELPNGKLLAVKKLDKRVSDQHEDDEFLDLVNNIDRIRHVNVVELMGYCLEHGQRLLVYEYCGNGTLQDALHSDDECKQKLSWNTRMRMALGAARALEYLHEVCEPPIIHRNFKSSNLLLDDELAIHVSDCGLAPLMSSGAVSQLSGQLLTTYGYGAPELESGIYTSQSDVFSFGVVMLELLTGRMSYDRTRTRGDQFLVRWAIPQLHDIDLLTRMVDPSISGKYPIKSLSNFADIISRCVQAEPEFRPPMSEVVQDLIQMIRRESHNRTDGK